MNKYVIRTSLVWIAVIVIAGVAVFYRWRHQQSKASADLTVQPIATAPKDVLPQQPRSSSQGQASALAPIQLSSQRVQSIGLVTAQVEKINLVDQIRATGAVEINDRLLSYVQVRFSGYVRRVFANAPLQFVKKGDPLFTIYSPEIVAAENEYLVALKSQTRLASSTVEDVSSGAAELVRGAEARLRQWDVPEAVIKQIAASGQPVSEMLITAPNSGYITERNALPNLYVEPSTRLYTLADLTRVWVEAQLFPEDISRVKPGDLADITVDALPGRNIRGRIEAILPQVDPATRTARVRLDLANPNMTLKPGMYVNVDLKAGLGVQTVVPATAVLMTGTRSVVFLDGGDGNLSPQEVTTGEQIGDKIVILKGLKHGQRIVSSGNFLVDSESQLQAAAEAFSPPPSGSGQVAVPPANALSIDLTTIPSPPQRGDNRFRVKLSDAQGKPISGANVTVVFYMAAMPAMGMAAMTTKSTLQQSDPGLYEGSGVLQSGGTWQVTVTVQRSGAVVATKQLNLTATGGM